VLSSKIRARVIVVYLIARNGANLFRARRSAAIALTLTAAG
jgi:hypothetical protein